MRLTKGLFLSSSWTVRSGRGGNSRHLGKSAELATSLHHNIIETQKQYQLSCIHRKAAARRKFLRVHSAPSTLGHSASDTFALGRFSGCRESGSRHLTNTFRDADIYDAQATPLSLLARPPRVTGSQSDWFQNLQRML